MQKWEYKTVIGDHVYFQGRATWSASYIDTYPVDDIQKEIPLDQRINALGQEGWELVNEYHDPGMPTYDYLSVDISADMAPISAGGKLYTKDNWLEYLNYLGGQKYRIVSATFKMCDDSAGCRTGRVLLEKATDTRIRRLLFKRPLD